jgi:hypothetical protein
MKWPLDLSDADRDAIRRMQKHGRRLLSVLRRLARVTRRLSYLIVQRFVYRRKRIIVDWNPPVGTQGKRR